VKAIVEVGILLLVTSACLAQTAGGTAEIRSLRVIRRAGKVRIEVGLTAPVRPAITVATSPDRLVVDLPNTTASARQRRIAVNRNGVKRIRVGLNSTNPLITRMVVDLDAAHAYELATAGNGLILTVSTEKALAGSEKRNGGAVPAAHGGLLGRLWPTFASNPSAAENNRTGRPSTSFATGEAGSANRKPETAPSGETPTPTSEKLRTSFQVKYVAEGAAYLNGGRSSGLAEGMKLEVRGAAPSSHAASPQGPIVAELQVVSVAETSAVTDIRTPTRDLKPGDWAFLSAADAAKLGEERSLHATGTTASAVLPETEPRQAKLRVPVSPEDSRIQARFGLDYSGIQSSGSTPGSSSQLGFSFRADMTRIAGTYWNLQGYMRERLTSNSQPEEETIENYLDRTYIIQLYYDNPNSKWVAGFGRLYLPWAVSLDTIDGGYVGRRLAHGVTTGVFFGSTPDPTSWHYQPDQQIGGSFVNVAGGSYEDFHYSSTAGMAFSMLKWQLDRPYLFLENGLSYRKYISLDHSLIVDSPQGVTTDGIKPGAGISRSYLSLHIQPHPRISFDIYHNYFRDVPTAATALIGTGLVDKLLYQGVSAGVHVELARHFTVYTTIGQSDKTGDQQRSLNQMYGLAWSEIWHTGIRADMRYAKFDSSFARGDYRVLSLSRHLGDRINLDAQVGAQTLDSPFTVNRSSLFVDTSFDTNLGGHSFLQSGYTIGRGEQLNYTQWYLSLGYRINAKGLVK
jgi:hypothetical protein